MGPSRLRNHGLGATFLSLLLDNKADQYEKEELLRTREVASDIKKIVSMGFRLKSVKSASFQISF